MRMRCGQVEIEGKIGFEMGNLLKDGGGPLMKRRGRVDSSWGNKKTGRKRPKITLVESITWDMIEWQKRMHVANPVRQSWWLWFGVVFFVKGGLGHVLKKAVCS